MGNYGNHVPDKVIDKLMSSIDQEINIGDCVTIVSKEYIIECICKKHIVTGYFNGNRDKLKVNTGGFLYRSDCIKIPH